MISKMGKKEKHGSDNKIMKHKKKKSKLNIQKAAVKSQVPKDDIKKKDKPKQIKSHKPRKTKEEEITKATKFAENERDTKQMFSKIVSDTLQKEEVSGIAEKEINELIPKNKLKEFVQNFRKFYACQMEEIKKKNPLQTPNGKYRLEVAAIKIANCSTRTNRIRLPHSLYEKDADICLIVPDIKRGRKLDDQPAVEHYEQILAEQNITNIKKVMTVSHLITEYSSYELKRRLLNTYDIFIVDGKISHRVGVHCGKIFSEFKKNPVSIQDYNKANFDKALHTVSYRQTGAGPLVAIEFAHHSQPDSAIVKNLEFLINWLKTNYPGGWRNIKNLYLRATTTVTFPIYCNFGNPNEIDVPVVESLAAKKINKEKKNLDGVLKNLTITSHGSVKKMAFDKKENKHKLKVSKEVTIETNLEENMKNNKPSKKEKNKRTKSESTDIEETVKVKKPKFLEATEPKDIDDTVKIKKNKKMKTKQTK